MEELIQRIVANLGIDAALAEKAVGIILDLFRQHAPADKLAPLMAALPGAAELAERHGGGDAEGGGLGGGLGGMLGGLMGGAGGLMAAVSRLEAAGLTTNQARGVGNELLAFAKEKAGDATVDDVVKAIPGLSALL